jgi:diadenosine tetraphosphate (Ap4A) HIT family hydrolase
MNNCIFCNIEEDLIIHEYKHFYVIRDAFPVTPLHSLVITKRHVVSYFQCSKKELDEIPMILDTQKTELKILDDTITGFNIGMNIGEDAGQTIFHCHIHVIPRRQGDTPKPRGGVRGVIPLKQRY